jgi:antitoxin (DNA-binding transcriptional repressor) of toxin-antitoxin stability system
MRQITATEAARQFSEVLDAVEHAGEAFLITRGGRAIATLGPVAAGNGRALKEALRSNRPDAAWADDIREARRLLTSRDVPWPD